VAARGSTWLARLRARFVRRIIRKRVSRAGLITLNVTLLLIVLGAIILYPSHPSNNLQPAATATGPGVADAPVDQLASVNIALTVARMADLPETAAVTNQADSEAIEQSLASTNNMIVDKPQSVVSSFISNKDIHTYIAQSGDSVASVAAKFGVTSNSILWSNNLASDSLTVGQKLFVPPVTGVVYTVQKGDTPATLATKFNANESQIIADNDAEISGLQVGEQIIIPNGIVTPVVSYYSYGFAWGSGAIYGFNGYDLGECTWYVATQIAVPANWGNASTWAAGAEAAGWQVSSVPSVGAIAQTPYAAGGQGHVGIVVAINGDEVEVKDMNNYGDGGGFDRVGEGWTPISTYQNYITP
jgi:surface antigen